MNDDAFDRGDGRDAAEVRGVFDRLLVDEPPTTLDPTLLADLERAGRSQVRRRRTVTGAAAAAVVGLAATLALAGPGLLPGNDAAPDPAGHATPAPVSFPLPDMHLTDAGERRIAEVMVGRLEEAYPDSEVSWERVWPKGVPESPIDPVDGVDYSDWRPETSVVPRASLRFTVSGQEGYVDLTSLWTRDDERSWSCGGTGADALDSCTDPDPRPFGDVSGGVRNGGEPNGLVAREGDTLDADRSVAIEGTLPVLEDRPAAKALLAGAALYVTARDLDEWWPRNVEYPVPDDELLQLPTLAQEWADDLGLAKPMITLNGLISAEPGPFLDGSVELVSPRGRGAMMASVDFPVQKQEPEDAFPLCPPDDDCATEIPVAGGRVELVDDGTSAVMNYVRDDGTTIGWRFDTIPEGWTVDELVDWVAEVGVFYEPR